MCIWEDNSAGKYTYGEMTNKISLSRTILFKTKLILVAGTLYKPDTNP
jgi:hypothetical protein